MVDDFFSFYLLTQLIVYAVHFHAKHEGRKSPQKTLLLPQENRP